MWRYVSGMVAPRCPKNEKGKPFQVLSIDAQIDDKSTAVDERSETVLKYKTAHFRAKANIQVPPLGAGEEWQVGWVQACTYMRFVNHYGDEGHCSWEFPELTEKRLKMISDSDGRHYPWYGNKTEVCRLVGPREAYQTIFISMNDNFYPHITWHIPVEHEMIPKLSFVERQQSFYTWLVAMEVKTRTYFIMKTIQWHVSLSLSIDCSQKLGKRVTVLKPHLQQQPIILNYDVPIETYALRAPNANSAQRLVWRPRFGNARVIVPSKYHETAELRGGDATKRFFMGEFRSNQSGSAKRSSRGRRGGRDESSSLNSSPRDLSLLQHN